MGRGSTRGASTTRGNRSSVQCEFVKVDGSRCQLRVVVKSGNRKPVAYYCVRHQPSGEHRRGWGQIRTLASGRLQVSYKGPDLQRHYSPNTFIDRDAAAAWLTSERELIERRQWTPPGQRKLEGARAAAVAQAEEDGVMAPTLRSFAPVWIEERLNPRGKPLTPRTKRDYNRLLESKIYPYFGDVPITSITYDQVKAWYRRFHKIPTEQAHAYQCMRTILNGAIEEGLIESNPCHIKGAGKAEADRTQVEPPSIEELAIMVEAMPKYMRPAVLLGAWCALRLGEVTALRRDDVKLYRDDEGNPVAGTIRIVRSVQWISGTKTIGDPKSVAGVRTIHIPPHLLPIIEDHLNCDCAPGEGCNRPVTPVYWKHAQKGARGLLFPNEKGSHLHPRTIGNNWYKARVAAGRTDLHFHDLRHFGATLAAQSGATTKELMSRLGHTSAKAAMRYQHAAADRDREIAKRLSELAVPPATARPADSTAGPDAG